MLSHLSHSAVGFSFKLHMCWSALLDQGTQHISWSSSDLREAMWWCSFILLFSLTVFVVLPEGTMPWCVVCNFHSLCPLRSMEEQHCSNYILQLLDYGLLSSEIFSADWNDLCIPSYLQVQICGYSGHEFVWLLPFLAENKAMPRHKTSFLWCVAFSSSCHKTRVAGAAESFSSQLSKLQMALQSP